MKVGIEQVALVNSYRGSGKSFREIAKLTGLARETVTNILRATPQTYQLPTGRPPDLFHDMRYTQLARCPTCGGKVIKPCYLCYVRSLKLQPCGAND